MAMEKSCILRHMNSYARLSTADESLLASLEENPQPHCPDVQLYHEGDAANAFHTVLEGWLYAYRALQDGTRQVLDIYVPGDVIGLREFAFSHRLAGVVALTPGQLCEFPKSRLTQVFRQSPTLSNLFFAIAAREQAVLMERLVNLGRRSAVQRLAHLTLELYLRLQRTNEFDDHHFMMPIPQHVLGDALGLSAVHVSRTFTELREQGLMIREGMEIYIPDLKRLKSFAGFSPHYLEEMLPES
jgi:CRP-like cAMP-binding protein